MSRSLRLALIVLALLLPMSSLVLLGVVWLWQSGFMLYWALGACLLSLAVYGFELWMLRPARHRPGRQRLGRQRLGAAAKPNARTSADGREARSTAAATSNANTGKDADVETASQTNSEAETKSEAGSDPDPSWSPRESDAWQAVLALAETVDPKTLNDRQAFLDLGRQTVLVVAQSLHPDETDPLLRFTLPEALSLVERVSARLRPFIIETIPLGDRITVGQFMRLYSWKSVAGLAGQAYDLWRIIRLMNPASAATQEMREKLSKQFYAWGRDALARKFARRYVEEVGRAAIELYGGRLKLSPDELAHHITDATKRDQAVLAGRTSEPLRILIAGQKGTGKSSLINAMSDEICAAVDVLPVTAAYTPYELRREGEAAAILLDSPGLPGDDRQIEALIGEAQNCDLIIWVVAASRADRQIDRQAILRLHDKFSAQPNRRRPPLIIALSQIDRLRPFGEWQPPYDLSDEKCQKAKSILGAMAAVSDDLALNAADIIPIGLDPSIGSFNVDALWIRVHDQLPDARAAQLLRCLGDAGKGFSWKQLGSQIVTAGRVIVRGARR